MEDLVNELLNLDITKEINNKNTYNMEKKTVELLEESKQQLREARFHLDLINSITTIQQSKEIMLELYLDKELLETRVKLLELEMEELKSKLNKK